MASRTAKDRQRAPRADLPPHQTAKAPLALSNMPGVVSKRDEHEIQKLHRYIQQKLTEIEQVYRYAPVGLVLMDMHYRFVRINERMAEINGLPVEAHIGRTLREVLPEIADRLMELYRPVYERGEPVLNVEIHGTTPKEPALERDYLANFYPFRTEAGKIAGLIGAVVDITERKRQEALLQQSEQRFRAIFETVTDAIFVLDIAAMKFVDVNQRAIDAFGYSREELLGKSIGDLSLNEPPYSQADAETIIASALTGVPQVIEWRCRRKDGTLFWVENGIKRLLFGERDYLLCTLRDISYRKAAEEELRRMAQFDVLTSLPNRRLFVSNLERAVADSRRRDVGIAVLYIDLDHFKDVNDTLGHPVGDRLLSAVAQRLTANVRASDTVARFGGDEFAILATNLMEPAEAGILAQKLIDAIALPFPLGEHSVHSGISVGIAMYEPGTDAETLLSHADVALYRAKADGRQTFRFFNDTMDAEVRERVHLVVELREAIAKKQFFLVYQPQVDVACGRITGLEALVRWRHPARGVLAPKSFIHAAERSGLINPLGNWVLRQACRQAKRWLDEGIAIGNISVNFSALQLKAPHNLEKEIDSVLVETELPARTLEMELTETTLMATAQAHGGILERLRERGVRIAIDDFGTGYASLAYLHRYPVDRIKLAKEFIAGLGDKPSDTAITQAVIGLARLLRIDIIAEGVETARQLEWLKCCGCTAVQGFYFGEPMSAEQITPLLRQGRLDGASHSNGLQVSDDGSREGGCSLACPAIHKVE